MRLHADKSESQPKAGAGSVARSHVQIPQHRGALGTGDAWGVARTNAEGVMPTSTWLPANYVSRPQPPVSFPHLQAKLRINAPNDRYEQEADRVADAVVHNGPIATNAPGTVVSNPATRREPVVSAISALGGGSSLQRECSDCETEHEGKATLQMKAASSNGSDSDNSVGANDGTASNGVPSTVAHAFTGAGAALDRATRGRMERAIGADFGGVRVHTDGDAARANEQLGARAFTHGRDIYFGAGEYAPVTRAGSHLLAHELVHTIQQGSEPSGLVQRQTGGTPKNDGIIPGEPAKKPETTTSQTDQHGTVQTSTGSDEPNPDYIYVEVTIVVNDEEHPDVFGQHILMSEFNISQTEAAKIFFKGTGGVWWKDAGWTGPAKGKAGSHFQVGIPVDFYFTMYDPAHKLGKRTGTGGRADAEGRHKDVYTNLPPDERAKVDREARRKADQLAERNPVAKNGERMSARTRKRVEDEFRDELLIDREVRRVLESFPPEFKGTRERYLALKVRDVAQLKRIAMHLSAMTPQDRKLFVQYAEHLTSDPTEFEHALRKFSEMRAKLSELATQAGSPKGVAGDPQAATQAVKEPGQSTEPSVDQEMDQILKEEEKSIGGQGDPGDLRRVRDRMSAKVLEHQLKHPGEVVTGFVASADPVKTAEEITENVKEVGDVNKPGLIRVAAVAAILSKLSGWLLSVLSILALITWIAIGITFPWLTVLLLVLTVVMLAASALEAELRLQAAMQETDPEKRKVLLKQSAAAQANVIAGIGLMVLGFVLKMVLKIVIPERLNATMGKLMNVHDRLYGTKSRFARFRQRLKATVESPASSNTKSSEQSARTKQAAEQEANNTLLGGWKKSQQDVAQWIESERLEIKKRAEGVKAELDGKLDHVKGLSDEQFRDVLTGTSKDQTVTDLLGLDNATSENVAQLRATIANIGDPDLQVKVAGNVRSAVVEALEKSKAVVNKHADVVDSELGTFRDNLRAATNNEEFHAALSDGLERADRVYASAQSAGNDVKARFEVIAGEKGLGGADDATGVQGSIPSEPLRSGGAAENWKQSGYEGIVEPEVVIENGESRLDYARRKKARATRMRERAEYVNELEKYIREPYFEGEIPSDFMSWWNNATDRMKRLALDADHAFRVTRNSIGEAMVMLEAESSGVVRGPVRRPLAAGEGEFIDVEGTNWDIKGSQVDVEGVASQLISKRNVLIDNQGLTSSGAKGMTKAQFDQLLSDVQKRLSSQKFAEAAQLVETKIKVIPPFGGN